MLTSTLHPPATTSLRDFHCCRPRHLSTSTSTSHPPAATASRVGHRRHRPCLPPRCWLMLTSHPTNATASRDHLCPCLPPCRALTLTSHPTAATATRNLHCCRPPHPCPCPCRLLMSCINVASSCRHHLAQSLSSSLPPSLSLSPPPVDIARPLHAINKNVNPPLRHAVTVSNHVPISLLSVVARDEFFHHAHGEGR
jgi:hypothetical protein